MKFEQMMNYDIRIRHTANNAIIVKVGCAEFAYTSPKEMLLAIADFYANPEKVEKEYHEFMNSNGGVVERGPYPDEDCGNTLARPTITGRGIGLNPLGEQPRPEPDDHEEVKDEEAAPRLGSPRFNFNLNDDDMEQTSEEEIVELQLGDLEEILEADLDEQLLDFKFPGDDEETDKRA